jgi:hypothetical protein
MSLPLTPTWIIVQNTPRVKNAWLTAQVPFRTASFAYSTWNK